MGVFSATVVAAVQARVNTNGVGGTPMGQNQLLTYLEAVDVLGQQVTAPAGVIATGGAGLTNSQYMQLYEMLF